VRNRPAEVVGSRPEEAVGNRPAAAGAEGSHPGGPAAAEAAGNRQEAPAAGAAGNHPAVPERAGVVDTHLEAPEAEAAGSRQEAGSCRQEAVGAVGWSRFPFSEIH
jgi:hypothetical protein